MYFGPKITVPKLYVSQAIFYNQDMDCHIEAFPQPTIRWARYNKDSSEWKDMWAESTSIYRYT